VPPPLSPLGPVAAAATPTAPVPRAARFGALLEARLGGARPPHPPPAPAAPLAAALRGVEAAQVRLESILAAARRGQAFSAGQLLALQADAHRLTQTLDVAGKLVEQGVQGVKQAIQTPL
jgi:hypothetical protein